MKTQTFVKATVLVCPCGDPIDWHDCGGCHAGADIDDEECGSMECRCTLTPEAALAVAAVAPSAVVRYPGAPADLNDTDEPF